jgi:hypothetical protein
MQIKWAVFDRKDGFVGKFPISGQSLTHKLTINLPNQELVNFTANWFVCLLSPIDATLKIL